MKRLIVYLNGERAGRLEQDDSGLIQFSYDQEWLDRPEAVPLSRSLPLQAEAFRGKKARPFFAGILPEEGPRTKIAAILGISERNDFAMLERIGGECAGAVSLLPEEMEPTLSGETRHQELSDAELSDIINELSRRPLMAGKEGIRLSLAGAQDKLPVFFRDGRFALPSGDTPSSTHILKPEPERFPGLATNEVYCMTLAKKIELNVPDVQFYTIRGKSCILVQRYDRWIDEDGVIVRLHQEDFCQALGYPPERKYQAEGGPLLRDCISLLRQWSTTPVLDIRDFIDSLVYNVIIGNADGHSKNYSMLYRRKERRLAPFYDLVCTLAWEELSKTLSMKIGGCNQINALTTGHWKKMAEETGLGWPMIRDRISELAGRVLDRFGSVKADFPQADKAMLERVENIVSLRAEGMVRCQIQITR